MSCEALLGVNFNTNKTMARDRSRAHDYAVLREYVAVMAHLDRRTSNAQGLKRLAMQTAGSLVHEAFYNVLNEKKPGRAMGVTKQFVRSQALEMFALATLDCPNCGSALGFEHLQHRGDLYCPSLRCMADIDVKSSSKGAHEHCSQWEDGKLGAVRTQFSVYPEFVGRGRFVFNVLDCSLGEVIGTSDSFKMTDLDAVTKDAFKIAQQYVDVARRMYTSLFKE
jgi:hypothetical protein